MLSIHNIWNVARIETKTLLRSWFFRIFGLLALVILFFFNMGIFTSAMGNSPWMFRGIPASAPYVNLIMLNLVQAAIAVFLASDFLKRDKKLDTTEVIYMRSMTNVDYVLGKTFGILLVFMSLNVVVLVMAFIFNFFFSDIPVNFIAYFWYPVLISFPTLVFILGLSFLFMVVIRNQPVTFIILLGYIAVSAFFLSLKYHHLFDYMSYYVPLMYSDFVGFTGFKQLLVQRGMYLFLGVSCIFGTILLIKRLPQSRTMTGLSKVITAIFLVLGFCLGFIHVSEVMSGRNLRSDMLSLNDELYDSPRVDPISYNIDLNHKGSKIESIANIVFQNKNPNPISEYIFSLNPGLEVKKIESANANVSFNRDLHIIKINPSQPLAVNGIDSLKITYEGKIDDRACYLDINEKAREQNYRYWMIVVNKRYSFVRPDYVLLTPENLWYPIPGVNFNTVHPEIHPQDFSQYSLTVKTDPDLEPISQGKMQKKGEGITEFTQEIKLPSVSLVIGNYEKRTVSVDSVDYNLFLYPNHDYFSQYMNEIGDTLSALIGEFKEDYEVDLDLPYLYPKLDIVEVPIQHFSYKRIWTLSQETVQPQMVLLPEKGVLINAADFKEIERREKRGKGRRGVVTTPKENQSKFFRQFVNEVFLGGEMRMRHMGGNPFYSSMNYKIFPNYFNFVNQIKSEKWPVFNVALETFLSKRTSETNKWYMFIQGLLPQDRVNIEFSEKSLSQLLADPDKREMIFDIIKEKGSYLFSMLQYDLGEDRFNEFLSNTIEKNRFKELDVDDLISDLKDQFSIDYGPSFDHWYDSKELPGYILGEVESYSLIDGDRTRYQVIFTISNLEPVDGYLKISFRAGGKSNDRGGSFNDSDVDKIIKLEGNQTKVVSIILDEEPREMITNTMISRNLPAQLTNRFEKIELNEKARPIEGERVLDQSLALEANHEIIVDNEDPGFEFSKPVSTSFVKRALNISNEDEDKYIPVWSWRPPTRWRATIDADFYGKMIRSAHFIKAGEGEEKVAWNTEIPSNGYYEIYYHLNIKRWMIFKGRGRYKESGEYHFVIHHDDGPEEALLDLKNAESGWNLLGSYYISKRETKVELTDETSARIVFADAVKWVKR